MIAALFASRSAKIIVAALLLISALAGLVVSVRSLVHEMHSYATAMIREGKGAGWTASESRWEAAQAKAEREAHAKTIANANRTQEAAEAAWQAKATEASRVRVIEKKVTQYVESPAGSVVGLDPDGVRLVTEDRAARGIPAPLCNPDEACRIINLMPDPATP